MISAQLLAETRKWRGLLKSQHMYLRCRVSYDINSLHGENDCTSLCWKANVYTAKPTAGWSANGLQAKEVKTPEAPALTAYKEMIVKVGFSSDVFKAS